MDVTCGLCGGKVGPHCHDRGCPWVMCVKCKALASRSDELFVWKRLGA